MRDEVKQLRASSSSCLARCNKEHTRLSNLRHGLYVLSPRDVLIALGEDPEEFDRYEQSLLDKWLPGDPFQEALVRRIACNSWRVDRARRVQESTSVREVEKLELDRAIKAENHARHIQGILAALKELVDMTRGELMGGIQNRRKNEDHPCYTIEVGRVGRTGRS